MGMASGEAGGKLNKTSKWINAIRTKTINQIAHNVPKFSLLGHGVPGGRPIYIVRSIVLPNFQTACFFKKPFP